MGHRHRCPWPIARSSCDGYTFVELLIAASILAIICAMSVPQMVVGLDRARAQAAARHLAAQMGVARSQAVLRGAAVALRAVPDDRGVTLSLIVDGNGNGVRTRDIDDGTDTILRTPFLFEEQFPGVRIGTPGMDVRDAIRFGGGDLLSFSPSGTATSGSVLVLGRDGSRFAIRVLGVTARVRIERYDDRSSSWVRSM